MASEKAIIYYQTDKNDTDLKGEIPVMFNPLTYTVSRNVTYGGLENTNQKDKTETKYVGLLKDYPLMIYKGGSSDTLNLELIFNKYEFKHYSNQVEYDNDSLSIVGEVKQIEALTLMGNLGKPPICKFSWSMFEFRGYITSFNTTYTMFLDDGTPVRAKMSLTIQGREVNGTTKVSREPVNKTKNISVKDNQNLCDIAYDNYSNPEKWREISDENNIRNPLDIKPGDKIKVPPVKKG